MANPGYGKRTIPAEPGAALRPVDFSHLPAREAYIAAYVHRLPEGAAMDVKSLAKVLPPLRPAGRPQRAQLLLPRWASAPRPWPRRHR